MRVGSTFYKAKHKATQPPSARLHAAQGGSGAGGGRGEGGWDLGHIAMTYTVFFFLSFLFFLSVLFMGHTAKTHTVPKQRDPTP